MSREQLAVTKDCAKFLKEKIEFLSRSLPIISPIDEEDKKGMAIGLDMLSDILDALNSAETAADYTRIFGDLEVVEEKWPVLKESICKRERESVVDNYENMMSEIQSVHSKE